MKVEELIDKLSKFDKDKEVVLHWEGAPCDTCISNVYKDVKDNKIIITDRLSKNQKSKNLKRPQTPRFIILKIKKH